jgi:hypothetical protein
LRAARSRIGAAMSGSSTTRFKPVRCARRRSYGRIRRRLNRSRTACAADACTV